jgi:arsenite methyltransferase
MKYSLYEQAPFRSAAGAEFRPGGLGLTEELVRECGLQPGERVLDLGCGVGSTASYLAKRWGVSVVGLDSSARFLEEAEARDPGVVWVLGRAHQIPFDEGSFDMVICECFLSTVDDPAHVLREIRRVVRSGGRLAVTDMYLRNPGQASSLSGLPAAACLRGAASREDVMSLLERADFTVRVWRDRSETLKAFAASMVFAYGSEARFWDAVLGEDRGCRESVALARPGYYLLVGEPRTDEKGEDAWTTPACT